MYPLGIPATLGILVTLGISDPQVLVTLRYSSGYFPTERLDVKNTEVPLGQIGNFVGEYVPSREEI